MKPQLLAPMLIVATTFTAPAMSQSSPSGSVQYFCKMSNNIPVTFARTPTETVEMIGWESRYFSNSGYAPEERCQKVSERFQKFSDEQSLKFITTGKMNNQNVMCVAQSKRSGCRPDGLLLTFEPNDDPQKILVELFDVSTRSKTERVRRLSPGSQQQIDNPLTRLRQQTYIDRVGQQTYIDVDKFLNNTSSVVRGRTQPEATEPVNETQSENPSNSRFNNHSGDTCSYLSIFCPK